MSKTIDKMGFLGYTSMFLTKPTKYQEKSCFGFSSLFSRSRSYLWRSREEGSEVKTHISRRVIWRGESNRGCASGSAAQTLRCRGPFGVTLSPLCRCHVHGTSSDVTRTQKLLQIRRRELCFKFLLLVKMTRRCTDTLCAAPSSFPSARPLVVLLSEAE